MSGSDSPGSPDSITALDYIESHEKLEHDAREALPYDPTHCTYFDGPLRQPVYACLTCIRKGKEKRSSGVCYSCSIQCHSDHELVELFNKRNFTCDCGTTRMPAFGGCNLRKNFTNLDIPSSTNRYCHNFDGKFCACDLPYDPENEKGTMFQCLLGDACNEDWFHEECILGLPYPPISKSPPPSPKGHPTEKDLLHFEKVKKETPPSPKGHPTSIMLDIDQVDEEEVLQDESTPAPAAPNSPAGHPTGVKLYPVDVSTFSTSDVKKSQAKAPDSPKGHPTGVNLLSQLAEIDFATSAFDNEADDSDDDGHVSPPGFPNHGDFESFICWKCINKHKLVLGKWAGQKGVALDAVFRKPAEEKPDDVVHSVAGIELHGGLKRKLGYEDRLKKSVKKVNVTSDGLSSSSFSTSPSSAHATTSILSSINEEPEICTLPKTKIADGEFSLFLIEGFRTKICRCESCLKTLDRFPVLKEQEVTYEPPEDEDETTSLFEAGTKALNSMAHLDAVEGLYAYNKIKEKLSSFLKPFADEGKIVSEQDVKSFFNEIKNK
ncbi:putative zinc finger in N-recognin-domain-containing protein [Lipomyces japonicus]|uniref:putative zinc finger in N-recognin-domain-containing protein n=1 Tax=Lipomyces japonicus TaxID=56871 RepID=UPI0034D01DC9